MNLILASLIFGAQILKPTELCKLPLDDQGYISHNSIKTIRENGGYTQVIKNDTVVQPVFSFENSYRITKMKNDFRIERGDGESYRANEETPCKK